MVRHIDTLSGEVGTCRFGRVCVHVVVDKVAEAAPLTLWVVEHVIVGLRCDFLHLVLDETSGEGLEEHGSLAIIDKGCLE